MANEFTIHEPFQKHFRVLSDEEQNHLRELILQDGPVYPIHVDQHNRIVDGHHTLEIYRGEGIEDFPVIRHDFADEDDAIDWIEIRQLGRRNLHGPDFTLALGRRYNRKKPPEGRPPKRKETDRNGQFPPKRRETVSDEQFQTSAQVAEDFGVPETTVRRGGKMAEAVDKLADNLATAYRAGTLKLTEDELLALAKKDTSEQLQVSRDVRTGKVKDFATALKIKKPSKPKPQTAKPKTKDDAILKDKHGRLVDKKHLVEVFRDMTIKELATEMKRFVVRVKTLRGDKAAFVTITSIVEHGTAIIQALENGLPAYICPACNGTRCQWCRKSGWMPAWAYTDYKLKQ